MNVVHIVLPDLIGDAELMVTLSGGDTTVLLKDSGSVLTLDHLTNAQLIEIVSKAVRLLDDVEDMVRRDFTSTNGRPYLRRTNWRGLIDGARLLIPVCMEVLEHRLMPDDAGAIID